MSDFTTMSTLALQDLWDEKEQERVSRAWRLTQIQTQIDELQEEYNSLQDFSRQQEMDKLNSELVRRLMSSRKMPPEILGDD